MICKKPEVKFRKKKYGKFDIYVKLQRTFKRVMLNAYIDDMYLEIDPNNRRFNIVFKG